MHASNYKWNILLNELFLLTADHTHQASIFGVSLLYMECCKQGSSMMPYCVSLLTEICSPQPSVSLAPSTAETHKCWGQQWLHDSREGRLNHTVYEPCHLLCHKLHFSTAVTEKILWMVDCHTQQSTSLIPRFSRESREMRLAINARTLNLLITNLSAAPKVSHHHLKYKDTTIKYVTNSINTTLQIKFCMPRA